MRRTFPYDAVTNDKRNAADGRFRAACFEERNLIEIITIGDELLCGRTLDTNAGIIATNGPIHDAVLEAVSLFVDVS